MPPLLSLKKQIVRLVYPFRSSFIDRLNRVPTFVDFARSNKHAPMFDRREEIYDWLELEICAGPIDYLEFGVSAGDSIRYWSLLNQHPQSRFIGFDSFEGLPEPWGDRKRGAYGTGGSPPHCDDPRVQFVKGLFQELLESFLREFRSRSQLVVHADADLYASTLYVLTRIDPLLGPGSIVIFDEFGDVQHEFRAFEDYCAAYCKSWRVVAATGRFETVAFIT